MIYTMFCFAQIAFSEYSGLPKSMERRTLFAFTLFILFVATALCVLQMELAVVQLPLFGLPTFDMERIEKEFEAIYITDNFAEKLAVSFP